MERLFITGASGFVGGHVARELARRGIACRCLVRATSKVDGLQGPGVELVQGAVEEPESYVRALDGCDAVIHVAGLTHALREEDLFRVNGEACGKLADACLSLARPPKLVYVSSLAAAGPPPTGKAVREDADEPRPISVYGRSKRAGERELEKRAGRLPITVIRPGVVYGPGDAKLAEMIRSIYRWRLHVVVGFRTPPLSLIHVEDLARLILLAAERGETVAGDAAKGPDDQGYYYACDDSEFPTYAEFGKRIASSLDRRTLVWPLWSWVGFGVGLSAQTVGRLRGRAGILNVDKVREAVVSSWASSGEKARRQLGFEPARPLDEHLRETSRWYVDNRWV